MLEKGEQWGGQGRREGYGWMVQRGLRANIFALLYVGRRSQKYYFSALPFTPTLFSKPDAPILPPILVGCGMPDPLPPAQYS